MVMNVVGSSPTSHPKDKEIDSQSITGMLLADFFALKDERILIVVSSNSIFSLCFFALFFFLLIFAVATERSPRENDYLVRTPERSDGCSINELAI